MLPLGAYAHPGQWSEMKAEKAAEPVSKAEINDDSAKAAEPKRDFASNDRIAPAPKTPLCASPAVSAWNEAATGKGIICKPTMWAGLDTRKG
jgi:hypothetical protein